MGQKCLVKDGGWVTAGILLAMYGCGGGGSSEGLNNWSHFIAQILNQKDMTPVTRVL